MDPVVNFLEFQATGHSFPSWRPLNQSYLAFNSYLLQTVYPKGKHDNIHQAFELIFRLNIILSNVKIDHQIIFLDSVPFVTDCYRLPSFLMFQGTREPDSNKKMFCHLFLEQFHFQKAAHKAMEVEIGWYKSKEYYINLVV